MAGSKSQHPTNPNNQDTIMTEGKPSPRERTLAELLDAARGLSEIEAAIAQLRGAAEMIDYDLKGFRADTSSTVRPCFLPCNASTRRCRRHSRT